MRNRTPKTLGTRHDPGYVHQRPRPRFANWRRWLGYGIPLGFLLFLGLLWASPFKSKRHIYSKGPLASAHAFIAEKCELCHSDGKLNVAWMQEASDKACLTCHEAPEHHSQVDLSRGKQPTAPSCASCHVEHQGHRGLLRLSHVQDRACVNCHQDLDQQIHSPKVDPAEARSIHKFNGDHPEFAAVIERNDVIARKKGPPGIVFHHAKHVGPTLKTLKNESVTLQCADCHRPVAAENDTPWKYVQAGASTAAKPDSSQHLHPDAGREIMTMPTYEKNCAGCHALQFDARFSESVPHIRSNSKEDRRALENFVRQRFQNYIKDFPQALQVPDPQFHPMPNSELPRIPELQPLPLASSANAWVSLHVDHAERDVLTGIVCAYCHQMNGSGRDAEDLPLVPVVQPAGFKPRQMPFAVFSHQAHIAVTCAYCHGDMPSVQGQDKTPVIRRDVPDVHLPGKQICQNCHNGNPSHAGNAEDSCFLCHQYHKWNERTEPPSRYTFQQMGLPPPPVQKAAAAN